MIFVYSLSCRFIWLSSTCFYDASCLADVCLPSNSMFIMKVYLSYRVPGISRGRYISQVQRIFIVYLYAQNYTIHEIRHLVTVSRRVFHNPRKPLFLHICQLSGGGGMNQIINNEECGSLLSLLGLHSIIQWCCFVGSARISLLQIFHTSELADCSIRTVIVTYLASRQIWFRY